MQAETKVLGEAGAAAAAGQATERGRGATRGLTTGPRALLPSQPGSLPQDQHLFTHESVNYPLDFS